MHRELAIVLVPLALSVAGGGLLSAQNEEEAKKSLIVELDVGPEDATALVVETFVEEGLSVTEVTDNMVTVGPFVPNKFGMVEVEIVYRVTVLPSSEGSRLIFAGTYKAEQMTGLGEATPEPLRSGLSGELEKAWERLKEIADAVVERERPELGSV